MSSFPSTPPATDLQALVYMSTAVGTPTREDLDHLLARARARNETHGVTGVLLYSEGSFMQYIEGTQDALDRVYEAIRLDPLHHHIFEVLREPIARREFAQWTMELRTTAASGMGLPSPLDDVARTLADPPRAGSPALLLLQAFWNRGLGTRYARALEE
ncbi:BLUF domain-containing protein [Caenimonas aquaedulcis]|uniref:BLUF domain-containing protein n=1 Tax=Caenimonas aquaedulcis TaxID=2793270 RepID=A0A931MER5_9BURK|nr:BLUF domain-containing protein [Caenimonas aquaedulcis]MBG9386599.1 BLUF domain-containing protein [Caenimonas aquaedulcis]